MISTFLSQLDAGCQQAGLRGNRVLVGLSGGPDSVALTRGLLELRKSLQLELHAGHLNHRLRGDESDQDAAWVAKFCAKQSLPLVSESAAVTFEAAQQGIGIEEAARRARYEFFRKACEATDCKVVALAHHADDQVETVLHHLLRGTGLKGLSGMNWRRSMSQDLFVARPMLEIRQGEIEAVLDEWNQEFRRDSTNEESHQTRNRLRNELLPLLREQYNAQVDDALLSLSRQACDIADIIDAAAEQLLDSALVSDESHRCRVCKTTVQEQPRHLIRQMFVQLWCRKDWPRQQMNFGQWDRLAGIALGEAEGGTFPGPVQVKRVRKELDLTCLPKPD